jgi:hypothetical protein
MDHSEHSIRRSTCFAVAFAAMALSACGDAALPEAPITPPVVLPIDETPCDYGPEIFAANQRYEIDCTMDLGGATAAVPESVALVYAGGQIIDGTLDFAADGRIDGDLLHQHLEVAGDVALIEPVFEFHPERWDLVQGTTDSDRALANTLALEALFFRIQELGGTEFRIGAFDCYFEVTRITPPHTLNFYPTQEAVNLPSNFTLRMSDDTHLRIFPARGAGDPENGAILSVTDVHDVMIFGGHLHGDRDERIYTPEDVGLEGSHLLYVNAAHRVTLDGIEFLNGSKGSLNIAAHSFVFSDDYDPASHIVVRNCAFTNSRRMAMSITNVHDLLIENNTFTNTANPSEHSDGGEVGWAINIEATRRRDEAGVLIEYERAIDIDIRGNREVGSRGGFVTVSIGQNVTIEDNDIDGRVALSLTNGSRVIHNRFTAVTPESAEQQAILIGGEGETVFDNEIYGNTISGYALAIVVGGPRSETYDNTILDGQAGIQIGGATDSVVRDNTIVVERYGIQIGNTSAGNIRIERNDVTAEGRHVSVSHVNQDETDEAFGPITIDDNLFHGDVMAVLSAAANVAFTNNVLGGGIQISNTTDTLVSGNDVTPNESDGIRIFERNVRLSVTDNTVSEPTGADRFVCLNNNDDTPDAVELSGNTCR